MIDLFAIRMYNARWRGRQRGKGEWFKAGGALNIIRKEAAAKAAQA